VLDPIQIPTYRISKPNKQSKYLNPIVMKVIFVLKHVAFFGAVNYRSPITFNKFKLFMIKQGKSVLFVRIVISTVLIGVNHTRKEETTNV